jgi:tRNA-specific 2-thiouridylase
VVGKDMEKNAVYVGQGQRHPALYCDELWAEEASWVESCPSSLPLTCKSKIRYRQADQDCMITSIEEGRVHVRFLIPQRAATLRQSIVFYKDDVCLGGAIINKVGPSYYHQGKPLPDHLAL